jgi:hypothetical protein
MARYGCLALSVVVALVILFVVVYLWSGWLNRPVGHSLPPTGVQVSHLWDGSGPGSERE